MLSTKRKIQTKIIQPLYILLHENLCILIRHHTEYFNITHVRREQLKMMVSNSFISLSQMLQFNQTYSTKWFIYLRVFRNLLACPIFLHSANVFRKKTRQFFNTSIYMHLRNFQQQRIEIDFNVQF